MAKRAAVAVLIGTGLIVLIMTVALVWLKIHEDDLVFAAERGRQHLLTEFPPGAQRTLIHGRDGADLASLAFRADPAADNGFWVLQLHGNADSAFSPWQVKHCEALRRSGFNVLDIDYRGFGLTPGHPSEVAMYEDAEAGYQELLRRGVAAEHIILLGHSLGSGPAVQLATRHKAAALVLFGAFTSIPNVAAEQYPYLPVRLAAAVQFNSLARIGEVHMPIVIAHSREDRLIPYSHALKLFAAANQPKRLITFDSSDDGFGGHVDSLFEHVDILQSALAEVAPAIPAPHTL
jgi:uncharacterized protein